MVDILFWLIISFIAALVGAALGRLVTLRGYSPLACLLLFITLGYIMLAYLLLGLGLLGYLQARPVLVVLAILLLGGLTAFRRLWQNLCAVTTKIRCALLTSPVWWLYWFLLLFVLASLLVALAPPAGLDWDGLAEHLAMAKEWVKAGRIIPLWYDHHSQFPATLQMLYALALLFPGAVAAKLFHFGFGLMAIGAVFVLTRRHLSGAAAPWAAAVLATTPVFSWLMGAAYVDLPVVACVLLSVHFFLEWISSGAVRDAALFGADVAHCCIHCMARWSSKEPAVASGCLLRDSWFAGCLAVVHKELDNYWQPCLSVCLQYFRRQAMVGAAGRLVPLSSASVWGWRTASTPRTCCYAVV